MTRTLHPNLGWFGKAALAFCGLLGVSLALSGLWAPAIGFLAAVGIVSAQTMPGVAALRLDENGFTMRHFGRESTTPWTDVETFVVITQRVMLIPIRRTVGYRFSKARRTSVFLKAAGALVGFEAQFPNNYGMKAVELAALLEAWRERAAVNSPECRIIVIH